MAVENTEKEDKLLIAKAEDAMRSAERKYMTMTVGFLNPRQRTLLKKSVFVSVDLSFEFEGGYPEAERTLCVFKPEYADFSIDEFISVIQIDGRDLDGLTHRDYLGSLMALGIVRENIGDIIVTPNGAFIFVKAHIADYILQNLTKIGRRGITCRACPCGEAELPKPKAKEVRGTVASVRLDAVLAHICGISRGKAVDLITKGLVCVNFEVVLSISYQIKQGDLLSVRGIGRIRISEIGGITRKGRTGILAERFE